MPKISKHGMLLSPLSIVYFESKGQFGPTVMRKLEKIFTRNLFIMCPTSGKNTKQLTVDYFDKIR